MINSLRNFFVSLFLWFYACFVLFTWYITRQTPDWAVLLRVLSSILNDLVWIPLGIIIWSRAIIIVAVQTKKGPGKIFFSFVIVIGVITCTILFPNVIFKFLFIPLALTIFAFFHSLFTRRQELQIVKRYIPLGLVVILTLFHYQYQLLPHKIESRSGQDIKIMSYNIYYDAGKEERKKVVETIKNVGADVVCCMEFNPGKDSEIFDRELSSLYPYKVQNVYFPFSRSASVIVSKFPITMEELPDKKGDWRNRIELIMAELDVKGKKVHIVNYHLKSVGHYIEYVADKKLDFKEKIDFAAKNEVIFDREKYTQAKYIESLITVSSEPAILCGDLNDTPNSRAFHILEKKYTNAFSSGGWGLGTTFGERKMKDKFQNHPFLSLFSRDVLRIDHIFVTRGMRVISAEVIGDARGSDHKPVVSIIEIK